MSSLKDRLHFDPLRIFFFALRRSMHRSQQYHFKEAHTHTCTYYCGQTSVASLVEYFIQIKYTNKFAHNHAMLCVCVWVNKWVVPNSLLVCVCVVCIVIFLPFFYRLANRHSTFNARARGGGGGKSNNFKDACGGNFLDDAMWDICGDIFLYSARAYCNLYNTYVCRYIWISMCFFFICQVLLCSTFFFGGVLRLYNKC